MTSGKKNWMGLRREIERELPHELVVLHKRYDISIGKVHGY